MKKSICIIILLFATVTFAVAQVLNNKGVPKIENFYPRDYGNHGKIWEIKSAANGMLYFASDHGLLSYDGNKWNSYRGSKGVTRALCVTNDTLIYSGSDLDFGVWKRKEFYNWEYSSLYPFKDNINQVSEEFWAVYKYNNTIVFASFYNLYIYKNDQITKIASPVHLKSSFQVNEDIFFVGDDQIIYVFDGMSLNKYISLPKDMAIEIVGAYDANGTIHFVSKRNGIYNKINGEFKSINNAISNELRNQQVFSMESIDQKWIAFGTVQSGLYISDLNGDIIHHFNKLKGLLNNTMLALHWSQCKKLWGAMDFGLCNVDIFSDMTYFNDQYGNIGNAQTALLNNDILYLGTNQGLYTIPWNSFNNATDLPSFQSVGNSEGQVWALNQINDNLLCGHDKGLYRIENERLVVLDTKPGVWCIEPIQEDYFLTGNYNGLYLYKISNGNIRYIKPIETIKGSCNQVLTIRPSLVFVNIPNFGIIRIQLDENFNLIDKEIYKADSVFGGGKIKMFKSETNLIVTSKNKKYIYTDGDFHQSDKELKDTNIDLVEHAYQPIALSSQYNFYPIYNGFALRKINTQEKYSFQQGASIFYQVLAFKSDTSWRIYNNQDIPHKYNNLKLKYIVPNHDKLKYRYNINDEPWSNWSSSETVQVVNLDAGNFNITIEAKNEKGEVLTESLNLTIDAPWYRTAWMYLFYVVLFISIILILRKIQKNKLEKQKIDFKQKEKLALEKQAIQIQERQLQKQQEELKAEIQELQSEIRDKTVALAKKAKDDVEKGRILQKLKDKLGKMKNSSDVSKKQLLDMQRLVSNYIDKEDKTFEIQIDELNQEFFQQLKEAYPKLSTNDLRLCAYVRMGLNSREISKLQGVLPSSVNVSRSRLRKKMNLDTSDDLYEVISKYWVE